MRNRNDVVYDRIEQSRFSLFTDSTEEFRAPVYAFIKSTDATCNPVGTEYSDWCGFTQSVLRKACTCMLP
jgi:hypothetical protein